MIKIAQPIVRHISDTRADLDCFEKSVLLRDSEENQKIIRDFPTVYIHNWKNSSDYEVYIGESNDIFQRTRQHYDLSSNPKSWQSNLAKNRASLYIIGHEHFNKSLTLDVENRLYQYMLSINHVKKVHNGRGNPQKNYYPSEEFEKIFEMIWRKLRGENRDLFPTESAIKDSAIFKASPFHKLTDEQMQAKELIIRTVNRVLDSGASNQIVFIDGEAGTGKTVLNSSTFYDLYCEKESKNSEKDFKCYLLVNHDEQITVYKQIADKLGITDNYGEVVCKPTSFINNHSIECPVDVVFVDEAHLLLTQGKQSYQGKNQLEDIIKRARVTVVMFDENQILTTEQIWEAQLLSHYRELAKKADTYFVLEKQLRMNVSDETLDWIDSFTKNRVLKTIPKDPDYSIVVFDSPEQLDAEIMLKAKSSKTALSRIIATYDWEYSSIHEPGRMKKYWEVIIGEWHKPWNRELDAELDKKQRHANKRLAWAEQPQTINEVGSTFTIQGFDLNYAGVILGPSVKYRDGKIVFDPENSKNSKAVQNRTLSDGSKQSFGENLIQHEVRVLMTRGVNGLYLFACDPALRQALKNASK